MKRLQSWERWGLIATLLLAWFLRWVALLDVPPGWRDDDLIELYTFSNEILESGPELYFAGASGHEPLYHTLRAPLIAVAGLNQASTRWQAAIFGTFTVLLTWATGRRLFTREVGLLSAALVTVSFWALMYSRVAIRHIGTLPWALLAIYWGWRVLQDQKPPRAAPLGMTVGVAGALLTYYAGRLIPALLGIAVIVVGGKTGRGKRYLIALGLGMLLAAPMFWAASRIPGADARVGELAVPLQELRNGNLQPLLQTTWTTLGMFHAKGDPEWLYNLSERPVFGLLGAVLFYVGILTRLGHLNQPNARMLLLWLSIGIAPAFVSLPASSLGHTILALPAVYILMTMPMKATARRWAWTAIPFILLTWSVVAARDLPDYFVSWPQHSMVRFLYRANYRALSRYLEAHPEITDAAVGSMLSGPWDKVAVETDLSRQDIRLRWLNPSRAILDTGSATHFYTQNVLQPHPQIDTILNEAAVIEAPQTMRGILLMLPIPPGDAIVTDISGTPLIHLPFADALILQSARWEAQPTPGAEGQVVLWWQVIHALPLPPEELIPYPPPPGVSAEPRLKVFTHLTTQDGIFITGDDGLWVDPYSLFPGDRFIQWHHLALPENAPQGPYQLRIGLYDPQTGERWAVSSGYDSIVIEVERD